MPPSPRSRSTRSRSRSRSPRHRSPPRWKNHSPSPRRRRASPGRRSPPRKPDGDSGNRRSRSRDRTTRRSDGKDDYSTRRNDGKDDYSARRNDGKDDYSSRKDQRGGNSAQGAKKTEVPASVPSVPPEAVAKIAELAALGRTEKQIQMHYSMQKFGLTIEQITEQISRVKKDGFKSLPDEARQRVKELVEKNVPEKQITSDPELQKFGLNCELILAEISRQRNEGVVVHVTMDYGTEAAKSVEMTLKSIEKKIVDKEASDAKDEMARHNAKQMVEKIKKLGLRLQHIKDLANA